MEKQFPPSLFVIYFQISAIEKHQLYFHPIILKKLDSLVRLIKAKL